LTDCGTTSEEPLVNALAREQASWISMTLMLSHRVDQLTFAKREPFSPQSTSSPATKVEYALLCLLHRSDHAAVSSRQEKFASYNGLRAAGELPGTAELAG
jgi:hypothetical protein